MKRILFSLAALLAASAVAQPPARRNAEAAKQQSEAVPQPSAFREFPTAQPVPENVAWRRDLYLALDLSREENAVLYYPTTPQDGRVNLFTYIFRLMLRGQLTAYDYKLDGNEDFSPANEVKPRELLDRYKVYYETKGDKFRVNDADLPADEVKLYYIKTGTYYDSGTSAFHTKVEALCPVLRRGDEFGGSDTQYPMFWVRYDDLAPQLGKLMLMGSSLNNAAQMSADDFFTLGCYKGDIYKTANLQDRILANYCPTDSALTKERARINREIVDFQDHMYGRDSVAMAKAAAEQAKADSLAAADKKAPRRLARRTPTRRGASGGSTAAVQPAKSTKPREKSSAKTSSVANKRARSGSAGGGKSLSVRRQRH